MDVDNAKNLLKALEDFGFASLDLQLEDFLTPGYVIQSGYPPNRIDLLTSIKGVDFETCYASRVLTEIDGIKIEFIDLINLRKNKKSTGRYQDLADLEKLE